MKNILFLISMLFLFSCEEEEDFSTPFYFAENGVTVKAKGWVTAGTTGELNGIFYTAVNIDTLRLMFSREEDVSKVVTTLITDMSNLFSNVPIKDAGPFRPLELQFNPNISSWDVSNVTNMQKMFGTDSSSIGPVYVRNLFNQDISSWDVSNVVDMSYMFNNCHFNQPINSWNVSNVRDMSYMFHSAGYFDQQLQSWDVSNVTNMQGMFGSKDAYGGGDFITFNQDISGWDVGNVTDMSYMFYAATSFEQNLNSWNTSNVTKMDGMFTATIFESGIEEWDVSNVTSMRTMFYTSFFNGDISGWDVSNVTDMQGMFGFTKAFNQDISNWCVSKITSRPHGFHSSFTFEIPEAYLPVWGTCPG